MLSLADEEATSCARRPRMPRTSSSTTRTRPPSSSRAEADAYAAKRRSDADGEAESIIKQARRQADEMLDGADRDAAARRQEAEAVYETQRAKAAAAAADFETTLAQRRENAEEEFTEQLGPLARAARRDGEAGRAGQERSRQDARATPSMPGPPPDRGRRAAGRPRRSPRAVRTPTGSGPSPTASWRRPPSAETASTRSSATSARCWRPCRVQPRPGLLFSVAGDGDERRGAVPGEDTEQWAGGRPTWTPTVDCRRRARPTTRQADEQDEQGQQQA